MKNEKCENTLTGGLFSEMSWVGLKKRLIAFINYRSEWINLSILICSRSAPGVNQLTDITWRHQFQNGFEWKSLFRWIRNELHLLSFHSSRKMTTFCHLKPVKRFNSDWQWIMFRSFIWLSVNQCSQNEHWCERYRCRSSPVHIRLDSH